MRKTYGTSRTLISSLVDRTCLSKSNMVRRAMLESNKSMLPRQIKTAAYDSRVGLTWALRIFSNKLCNAGRLPWKWHYLRISRKKNEHEPSQHMQQKMCYKHEYWRHNAMIVASLTVFVLGKLIAHWEIRELYPTKTNDMSLIREEKETEHTLPLCIETSTYDCNIRLNSLCLCMMANCWSVYLCIRRTLVECRLVNRSFNVLSLSLNVNSSTDGGSNVSLDWESSSSSSAAAVSSSKLVDSIGLSIEEETRRSFPLMSTTRSGGVGSDWDTGVFFFFFSFCLLGFGRASSIGCKIKHMKIPNVCRWITLTYLFIIWCVGLSIRIVFFFTINVRSQSHRSIDRWRRRSRLTRRS